MLTTSSYALRTSGLRKFFSDAMSVFEIQLLPTIRQWYLMVLASAALPLPMFYAFRAIAPDDAETVRRLLAGTIVFGVAFATAMLVGQNVLAQRFLGTLKLLITMPVSKIAYLTGTLLYTSITGCFSVAFLLAFGLVAGIDMNPTWGLIPILLLTVLSLSGLTIFVLSFAPSLQIGNILATLLAIGLVIISPVYYTAESAPLLQRWLGVISPMRYAADGISASLGGGEDIWFEIAVLAAYSLVSMSLGIWRLPWRES